MILELSSEKKTFELAKQIAGVVEAGDILLLNGPLGAGKTTFIKALCKKLGVKDEVVSPTFIIAQQYVGSKFLIHHLDLYRIDDVSELEPQLRELPPADGILVMEWAEKLTSSIRDHIIDESLTINLSYGEYGVSENSRVAELIASDKWKNKLKVVL